MRSLAIRILRAFGLRHQFDPLHHEYKEAFIGRFGENNYEKNGMRVIKAAIDDALGLPFPLVIYRGLCNDGGDAPENSCNVRGWTWTTCEKTAERYARKPGYVITAELEQNNIDWVTTIERKIRCGFEDMEIFVRTPAKLKILKISRR